MTVKEIESTADKIGLIWELILDGSPVWGTVGEKGNKILLTNKGFYIRLCNDGTWTLVETAGR